MYLYFTKLSGALILSLVLLFAACGSTPEESKKNPPETEEVYQKPSEKPAENQEKTGVSRTDGTDVDQKSDQEIKIEKEQESKSYNQAVSSLNPADCPADPELNYLCRQEIIYQQAIKNSDAEKCQELDNQDLENQCLAEVG